MYTRQVTRARNLYIFCNGFPRDHYLVWWVRVKVRVKFSLGARASGMIRLKVDVGVMVRVSNLLGSD